MRNPRTNTRHKSRATIGLIAASALILVACGSDDDSSADTTDAPAEAPAEAATSDSFEVFALLPQGTDQPYGTTYLPPFEAKAAELGLNLNIVNSGYDGEQQASDCEVAVAAQPDLIILWPAVGDQVRPCLEAADAAGIPVTVTNSDLIPEDQELS
ncbi:MAG: ribose transport system substrate-binding protein, partial [Ilumatobacter sp.]